MIENRMFHIVLVRESGGTGVDRVQNPEKIIRYDGKRMIIELE